MHNSHAGHIIFVNSSWCAFLKAYLLLRHLQCDLNFPNGSLVVIENIIDDDRNINAFGPMMSLNMSIETKEGYDFPVADFKVWADDIGFREVYSLPLTGHSSAVFAVK